MALSQDQKDIYFRELEKESNDKFNRYMRIKLGADDVATIKVELASFSPLYQSPSEVIREKEMVDIRFTKNFFSNYSFTDYIVKHPEEMNPDRVISRDVLNEYLSADYRDARDEFIAQREADFAAKDAGGNTNRYIELLTIENPLTQVTYTIFVDRLNKDMFYVSGLNLILDSNITPDPDRVLVIRGIRIGGEVQQTPNHGERNKVVYDVYAYGKNDGFSLDNIITNIAEFTKESEVSVKAVTFTRDLPSNISNTNYPVFYDKLMHVNGTEIQLARQDTIPLMWIKLGKIGNFLKANSTIPRIPNLLIYNYGLNNYRTHYNGRMHKDDTVFAFCIPIY